MGESAMGNGGALGENVETRLNDESVGISPSARDPENRRARKQGDRGTGTGQYGDDLSAHGLRVASGGGVRT